MNRINWQRIFESDAKFAIWHPRNSVSESLWRDISKEHIFGIGIDKFLENLLICCCFDNGIIHYLFFVNQTEFNDWLEKISISMIKFVIYIHEDHIQYIDEIIVRIMFTLYGINNYIRYNSLYDIADRFYQTITKPFLELIIHTYFGVEK